MVLRITILALFCLITPHVTVAAEIHLKAQCVTAGSVVFLRDLATVVSGNSNERESLAQIELFPAPIAGRTRIVRMREIQDILILRGVNTTKWSFFGASRVTIQSTRPRVTPTARTVSFQQPEPSIETALVVAASRPIQKGDILRATDVSLTQVKSKRNDDFVFDSIEDVIGKQATRPIAIGHAIDSRHVRRPLLVRRGEVVTVYARSAGIQVRTNGRALEDGSQGDLVSVESLINRDRYTTRVVDIQEVEVYANSVKVTR